MAYNTKPIVTDVDGNPISQYYNPETDQYEPVEGQAGANKVVLYNADGTENNNLSLIPILEKLSELTGTVIDEQTRQSNEQQRITFYNQLVEMLNTGQLKGDKGDTGETGQGLEFDWDGTRLGVRVEGDEEYIYVDLRGPQGPAGNIDNLTSQHIETALGYTPVKSVNNVLADEAGNVELDIDTSEIENRIGNVEDDLDTHKADYALDLNSRLNGVYKVGRKHFNILRTPLKNTRTNVFKVVTDITSGSFLLRVTGEENLGKPIMFLIRIHADDFSLCKYSSINQETPEIKISKENNNVVLWFNHVGYYIAYVFDVLHSYSPYSNTTQWEVFEVEPSQIPAEAVSIPLYE